MPQSEALPTSRPRVTLVMTVRERYRLTPRCIDDILARTQVPYRFLFAHGELPAWLDQVLDMHEKAGHLERRYFPGMSWPQQLRGAAMADIDTEFVAFIDNDILVSEGWLEKLLACADETGAGIVGPVYLWGDGVSPPKVHMAGGTLVETPAESGPRVLKEVHGHIDADPAVALAAIQRGPCDFVEFHCMLVRTGLARAPGTFDPGIVAVHEHIDTCLSVKAAGGGSFLEPSAQVTYLAHAHQILEDLALMRHRWDDAATEASIQAFCRKWNVHPDNRSWGGVRGYAADLRWRNDPLRRAAGAAQRERPMTRADLPQSRAELVELALARGYEAEQVALLARACSIAATLFDGGYRPCGRPFINHAIGVAGVLVFYDFCIECVSEALLQAAYSHRRGPPDAVQAVLKQLHPQLELRVRQHTQRRGSSGTQPPATTSTRDGEFAAIQAANEIELHLAREYVHSGLAPELGLEAAQRLAQILELLGVPGMARTLLDVTALAPRPLPPEYVTNVAQSYRIGPANSLVPMASR